MRPAIAVFAKAPVAGQVKTRLAATVGPVMAALLQEQMVSMLLQRLTDARESLAADIELHTDIPTDAWTEHTVTRRVQVNGDLGTRMLRAISEGLAEGRPTVLLLGGDVPTVPEEHLQSLLLAPEDVAIGPAEDGGYYAIACRRTHSSMFEDVAWSTATACEQTVAACLRAGLSVSLGPLWFDIDEPSDLDRI